MSTGTDCTVYIAGQRVADGRPSDDPTDPVVLSGLTVTWGRTETVDQPEASTCSFQLLDDPGGTSFLDLVRTGLPVDVVATGTIFTDPDTSTILDPTFDTTPTGDTPASVRTQNSAATVQAAPGDRRALQMVPVDAGTAQQVLIAPAPFSPSPGAWDEIPQTVGGQTWGVAVDVHAPLFAQVTVQPVMIGDPSAGVVQPVGAPVTVPGTGGFQTIETTIVPTTAGAWIGVRVRVYPTGPRWNQATGTWAGATGTWLDRAAVYVTEVKVTAPEGGVTRSVLVFSGRITDVAAGYDDTLDAPTVDVIAADFTADLENVRVGDEPWMVEPFEARFQRVLDLAGVPVDAVIDTDLTGIPLSYQDVDSQAATGLLKDFAQSVDAVMWSAVHQTTGPYLHVEDPSARTPLYTLTETDTGTVVITPASATGAGQQISACDVLRDPVTWQQAVSDVATRVAVTWLEQGVDDEGRPTTTERTEQIVDAGLEATYGQRGISVSTLLQDVTDAHAIAQRILTRTSIVGWRVSGLTIDDDESLQTTDHTAVAMLLKLLDGTSRNGLPIVLTDLPDWSPIDPPPPVYTDWVEVRRNLARYPLGPGANNALGFVGNVNGSTIAFDPPTHGVRVMTVAGGVKDSGLNMIGGIEPTPADYYTVSMDLTGVVADAWCISAQGSWVTSLYRSAYFPVAAGQTVRIAATFPTTGSASRALYLLRSTAAVASEVIVSNVTFEQADTAGATFFDGDTLDTELERTRWLGPVNASPSVLEVREVVPQDLTLPVYLEGGTYTHEDGTWTLALTVSNAEGQGQSVDWDELDPGWAWGDFDPSIAWDDLVGVGPAPEGTTP